MLSVRYAGKNVYSGVVPLELIGAMCSPTVGGGGGVEKLRLKLTSVKVKLKLRLSLAIRGGVMNKNRKISVQCPNWA